MTAVGMLAIGAGVLLIWAGVKNEDPREVIARILSGKAGTASATRDPQLDASAAFQAGGGGGGPARPI